MQLSPRYGDQPVLRVEGVDDPAGPALRQRRRLGDLLASLDAAQWSVPSRCEGWTVQDVVSHLVSTNQFWAISVTAAQQGSPTTFLATFDPVASPAQLVDRDRGTPPAEILARYRDSVEQLADALAGVAGEGWQVPAEAPPGHIPTSAVVAHALWDGWVHERDVLLPLGLTPVVDDEEVAACLRYVVGLGPALAASAGSDRTGTLVVEATAPAVRAVVEVGPTVVVHDGPAPADAPVLRGDAVALVEGLSFRTPLEHDLPPADEWLLGGLDRVFDRV